MHSSDRIIFQKCPAPCYWCGNV